MEAICAVTYTKNPSINPACRCVTEDPCHEITLLTCKEDRQTHVPVELRQEVERWVEENKLLKSLVAEMSRLQKERLLQMRRSLKNHKG